jgi:hemolysin activation/secretion protein
LGYLNGACFLTHVQANPPQPLNPTALLESFDKPQLPQSESVNVQEEAPVDEANFDEGKDIDFRLEQIILEGNTVYSSEELSQFYKDMIGTSITPQALFEIASRMTSFYRNNGYILSRAYVPIQEIEDGIVQIRILEGFIDDIQFEWADGAEDRMIKSYATRLKRERPLNNKSLERSLLLMKDLPGVTVSAVLKPSAKRKKASDMILMVSRKPITTSLEISNDNPNSLGPWKVTASVSENGNLGFNERITLFGALSYPSEYMKVVGTEYSAPIFCNGTTFNFKADWLQSQPDMSINTLKSKGQAENISIGIKHPILRGRDLSFYVSGWLDIKNSRNGMWESGFQAIDSRDRVRVFRLESSLDFADKFFGVNLFTLSASQGIHGLGAMPENSPYKSRPNGKVSFSKFSLSASRIQNLGYNFSLYTIVRGQYAPQPLLSIERFNFGGPPYTHTYESGVMSGDSGLEAKAEVRYTRLFESVIQQLQFFGYYDYGMAWNKKVLVGDNKVLCAPGVGVGLRAFLEHGLSMNMEYGIPLKRKVGATDVKNRLYFGISYNNNPPPA